jgi:hypothetical protein
VSLGEFGGFKIEMKLILLVINSPIGKKLKGEDEMKKEF